MIALLSNIIDVESWSDWESKDGIYTNIAFFKSNWPETCFNKSLTGSKNTLKYFLLSLADEFILISKSIIFWILEVWVDETVSNSHSLEVELKFILVLEHEVMRDSWDVVTSITLSSDEEVFTLELWVFLKESLHESSHIVGDFFLISVQVSSASMGEPSSNWLINIKDVSKVIP